MKIPHNTYEQHCAIEAAIMDYLTLKKMLAAQELKPEKTGIGAVMPRKNG